MILTVIQDTEQTQLKAPVFILDRQELGIVASGSMITVTEIPEEPEERQAFFSDEDNGYLVLGSTATVVERQATINPVWDGRLPAPLRKVNTINGVGANAAGEFFIDGSECDSWGYIKNGIAEGSGKVDEEVWFVRRNKVTGELIKYKYPNGFGIWLTDACPACTSCETIYRLKYEVENLKMWLNTLKDVNMYRSTLYGDIPDHVAYRRDLLNQQRITEYNEDQACSSNLQPDDKYMQLQGIQLLQQYMTVVHMWNYVVSRNNSSTLITIAPEDTTGFVVQTKRALTSCGDKQSVRCFIRVYPSKTIYDNGTIIPGLPSDYPDVSIYVPDKSNTVEFEPYLQEVLGNNDIYITDNQSKALGSLRKMTITNERTKSNSLTGARSTDCKRADTSTVVDPKEDPENMDDLRSMPDFIEAKVAGTYVVTTKFLPFIYYRVWRGYKDKAHTIPNYISIRGGTAQTISGEPGEIEGSTVYDFGITDHDTITVPDLTKVSWQTDNPTENDYLQAKTAPTCSTDKKILWHIHIEWWIKDKDPQDGSPRIKKEEEDYLYRANGIRTYFGDIMSNTTVLPLEPDEPEQTGE